MTRAFLLGCAALFWTSALFGYPEESPARRVWQAVAYVLAFWALCPDQRKTSVTAFGRGRTKP